ncbi:MAG: cytochrome b/b6 domain-containing protein [Pseudomonadales bacterium]
MTLLIGTLIFPISGMIMSGLGGQGLAMLRLEVYPHNPDSQDPTHVSPFNEAIAGVAHETDEILGIVFILAITLHIAGALKHHLMDKDGTLRRMLGKN